MKSITKDNVTTKKNLAIKKVMSFLLMSVILIIPSVLFAQQEKTQMPVVPAPAPTSFEHNQGMPEMQMKECDGMMSRMKEMDARLDAKVAVMDAAKGTQKVEAMASVIKEMVSQRKEMQEHMMRMHDMKKIHGMGKGHMMEHMKPEMESDKDLGNDR